MMLQHLAKIDLVALDAAVHLRRLGSRAEVAGAALALHRQLWPDVPEARRKTRILLLIRRGAPARRSSSRPSWAAPAPPAAPGPPSSPIAVGTRPGSPARAHRKKSALPSPSAASCAATTRRGSARSRKIPGSSMSRGAARWCRPSWIFRVRWRKEYHAKRRRYLVASREEKYELRVGSEWWEEERLEAFVRWLQWLQAGVRGENSHEPQANPSLPSANGS
jgi:hypothetical protein